MKKAKRSAGGRKKPEMAKEGKKEDGEKELPVSNDWAIGGERKRRHFYRKKTSGIEV